MTDPMQCEKCGEPVTMTDTTGGTNRGESFSETYECVNGHHGWISGKVGNSEKWNETGEVFNGY